MRQHGRSHLTDWKKMKLTLNFSNSDNVSIVVAPETGEAPFTRLEDVMNMFSGQGVQVQRSDDGVLSSYIVTAEKSTVIAVLTSLAYNHLEQPPLPDHLRKLIAQAAMPQGCNTCQGEMESYGNIFRCGNCGHPALPVRCGNCGGELLANETGGKTCPLCKTSYSLQASGVDPDSIRPTAQAWSRVLQPVDGGDADAGWGHY